MRSLTLMALVCCVSQLSFAALTQSHTHSATLSQTSKAQPITINPTQFKLNLPKAIEPETASSSNSFVGSPAITNNNLLIEPETATAGSPATSIASSVESGSAQNSARSNKSPLDSGRLIVDSEEINPPLPETTATSTTGSSTTRAGAQVSPTQVSQSIATIALALTIPTTASAQTTEREHTERACASENTQRLITGGHMSFGTEFDAGTQETPVPLERGMIGYNTELSRIRSNSHPVCVRKSNSSPEDFVTYPYPPRSE